MAAEGNRKRISESSTYLRVPPPDGPDKYRNISLIHGRSRPAGQAANDRNEDRPPTGLPGVLARGWRGSSRAGL